MFWSLILIRFFAALSFTAETSRCVDLSQGIEQPLLQAPILLKDAPHFAHGKLRDSEIRWGAARAIVAQPIEKIYAWLLVHENWKDTTRAKLKTVKLKKPPYLEFHVVSITLKVKVLFFNRTIRWKEHWAYRLLEGSAQKPENMLVYYQKASGDSDLKHLCGSIRLHKVAPTQTDLYFYEEGRWLSLSSEDIVNMHRDNLKILKKLP